MGFGELTEWVIGKIKLKKHKRNEKFGSNPFGRRRIYIIPLKTLYFPALIGGIEYPRRLLRFGLRRSSRMEIKKHVAATIIIDAPEVKLKV